VVARLIEVACWCGGGVALRRVAGRSVPPVFVVDILAQILSSMAQI
jgi:hypothetical protein